MDVNRGFPWSHQSLRDRGSYWNESDVYERIYRKSQWIWESTLFSSLIDFPSVTDCHSGGCQL